MFIAAIISFVARWWGKRGGGTDAEGVDGDADRAAVSNGSRRV